MSARLGVLALSPITCATAAVCSFFSLYALIVFFHQFQIGQRVFLGLLGSSMALLTLASVIGFMGAIIANFRAVNFYSLILSHLWLSVVLTGVVNFIFLMKDKKYFVQSCEDTYKDQHAGDITAWCNDRFTMGFAFMVAFWGAVAILALYLISIVRRYTKQLADEK